MRRPRCAQPAPWPYLENRHDIGVRVEQDRAQAGVCAQPGEDQHHAALAHLQAKAGCHQGGDKGTRWVWARLAPHQSPLDVATSSHKLLAAIQVELRGNCQPLGVPCASQA